MNFKIFFINMYEKLIIQKEKYKIIKIVLLLYNMEIQQKIKYLDKKRNVLTKFLYF